MAALSSGIVLATVVVLTLGATWLEGRTITRSVVAGALPNRVTTPVGWTFLLSEVWVVALLGLVHAALPATVHGVFAAAWLPLTVFGLAWMLRDWGLWQLALRGVDRPWRAVAAVGAGAQALALIDALVVATAAGAATPPDPGQMSATTAGVLAIVAPVCTACVGALQIAGWRLTRAGAPPRVRRSPGSTSRPVTGHSGSP
ncbi:hypothetical protein [Kribbia dieselivorans]|uniref:hypothetical protein n=1 Tax=Kribbia dieselivorans TaxID=331526 RepID=UPI000838F73E|nr:hypothetical protein [Kribbia dieselivorans]